MHRETFAKTLRESNCHCSNATKMDLKKKKRRDKLNALLTVYFNREFTHVLDKPSMHPIQLFYFSLSLTYLNFKFGCHNILFLYAQFEKKKTFLNCIWVSGLFIEHECFELFFLFFFSIR